MAKEREPGYYQPRNRREEELIEHTLAHADEIKAARGRCRDRAIVISPHWSQEEREAARARLQRGGGE